jgi:hypothetical protein
MDKRIRFTRQGEVVFAAIAVMLLVSACGVATPAAGAAKGPPRPTVTPSNLHVGVEVDMVGGFQDAQVLCAAPLIALVTVARVGPSIWNPAFSGAPTSTSGAPVLTDPDPIITPISFSSIRVVHDRRTGPTNQYAEHGGVIGSDIDHVDGVGSVQPGETAVVIFMPGYDARTHRTADANVMLVTWAQPVDQNGQMIVQQHTTEPGVGTIPTITEPLSQFERQLAQCS